MDFFLSILKNLPDGAALGLVWGIKAIGVYITFKILDIPVSYTHLAVYKRQDLALAMVDEWLDAQFEGGRHQRRVDMLDKL